MASDAFIHAGFNRRGRNTQLPPADLSPQSVHSRVAPPREKKKS